MSTSIDSTCINTIRCLGADIVQKANSGHPGAPMGCAPMAHTLFHKVMRFSPAHPQWANRDRFVLSNGHASMLTYGLLHLAGVHEVDPDTEKSLGGKLAVSLDDIKSFRQIGSKCPGHPEYQFTTGVEMTTGPLGQGVASSVGMAMASKWFAGTFNKPKMDLFGFDVYAICGDGCLMEGVAAEAASLAGHLKLDNLCWIFDNNHITIEGNTAWATSEEIATRFISYQWNVNRVGDANDLDSLTRAFNSFKRENERPTLIIVDSHIAWGSPSMQDHFSAHGTPLGKAEVTATKKIYDWPDEEFYVPESVTAHFQKQMAARGGAQRQQWEELLLQYKVAHPESYQTLKHIMEGTLPKDWDKNIKGFETNKNGLASRQSSSKLMNQVASMVPWMLGGSADLSSSCLTTLDFEGAGDFMPPTTGWGNYAGRNMHYGIREHAMGSITNGLALCKLRPFCSTFLVFSDYMKPSLRMASFMKLPCIFIFTHDSISVGEDGPTHQPVEQLSALRSIPGILVMRPCDGNEAMEMWKHIMTLYEEPVAVVLTRQALPTLDRTKYAPAEGLHKGGYVIAGDALDENPELILMASGSEVSLMLEAHEELVKRGVKVRSVSMPCLRLFKNQPQEYMDKVLPPSCRARVSIEAGRFDMWATFVGLDGEHIGVSTFGESGPMAQVTDRYGFSVKNVLEVATRVKDGKPISIHQRAKRSPRKRRKVAA